MAKDKYGWKITRKVEPGYREVKVIDQKIMIGQVNRGPADMTKYRSSLASAESIHNPNRRAYYDLAENVLTDGILSAVIDKRIRAVTVSPPSLEGTEDEKLIQLFKAPWMHDLLRYMMEAKFWGHSLVELEYNPKAIEDPELEQLFKVKLVPRKNVSPEFGMITEMAGNTAGGTYYREEPYINYLVEIGKERDLGMMMNLIPYVLFKRNNWSDFAQFNELFGMPMRVYEYDPHQTDSRKTIEDAAKKAGAASYVVVPKGTMVNHISTSTSAGSGGFKDFNSIMNQELTITVLGQTLTTGADGKGSYALGDVHKDVEEAINLEDKVWIEYQMNWVVKPLLIKTFGLSQLRGTTWKFDDTIKLTPKEKMEIFVGMLNAGVPMKLEYIYEELNMPVPDESDMELWKKLKEAMQSVIASGAKQSPEEEEIATPPSSARNDENGQPKKEMALMLTEYGFDVIASGEKQSPRDVKLSYEDDIRAEIDRIIAAIHAGTMQRGEIPARLVELIFQQLNEAVTSGYGSITQAADQDMIRALRSNTFSFAAAKEFNFIRDAFDNLVDTDGNVKTFQVFRDEVLSLHEQYNINWLKAEYNAAVGNAQMASKWTELTANATEGRLLKFRAVLDDRSRHKKYHNVILPIDHPAWDYMMPLLDWNCRCTVNPVRGQEQTAADKVPTADGIKPAFRFNPGKTKQVFSKTHPYWTSLSPNEKENAANNFGLTAPKS
jgi:phage gp29-like protein